MKVYCFYLRLENVQSPLLEEFGEFENYFPINGENVCLYAYTTNKKCAKDFCTYRNMDKFFPIKIKMSENEFKEFKKESGTEKQLDYFMYDIRDSDGSTTYCKILTTLMESDWYFEKVSNIENEFENAYVNSEFIESILECLKKKYRTDIGVEELYLINEIAYKIAIGEPVTVPINGINFLLTEFGELFK